MNQKSTVTEHMLNTSTIQHLEDVLEYMDRLHNVASDSEAPTSAEMSNADMMNVLRDIIYTAQETLVEMETAQARERRHVQPVLRILPKVDKAG